jgi:SAM-dependent methyltransferase
VSQPTWRHYLTDYNEGLGLVYERFVLNDFLEGLQKRFGIQEVLEAPLYGMAGVSGINSVRLAQLGCRVTLVDDEPERVEGVRRLWAELGLPAEVLLHRDWAHLPFGDRQFDLCWQWAGLWYLADPPALIRELMRLCRGVLFLAMPNRWQVGYWLRKHMVDRAFFQAVREEWADMRCIRRVVEAGGFRVVEQGVLDVPPWPDTVMPAAELLRRLGIRSQRLEQRFSGASWTWSTMAYYLGEEPDLRERVMRYAFLDRARLPWQVKALWAHHRYLLAVPPKRGG